MKELLTLIKHKVADKESQDLIDELTPADIARMISHKDLRKFLYRIKVRGFLRKVKESARS